MASGGGGAWAMLAPWYMLDGVYGEAVHGGMVPIRPCCGGWLLQVPLAPLPATLLSAFRLLEVGMPTPNLGRRIFGPF